jgi:hypothetical protein
MLPRSKSAGALNRRFAIGAIAVAAAGLALPRMAQIRPILQRGMVGGGLAQFEESEAQFSVFASRISSSDGNPDVIAGSVLWHDAPSGYLLTSTTVTDYEMLESAAHEGVTRRISGTMRLNDGEVYPFVLNVTDAGPPASGLDSVALIVGDGAEVDDHATPATGFGFSYAAAGPIVVGDVQEVDIDLGTGLVVEGASTPTH